MDLTKSTNSRHSQQTDLNISFATSSHHNQFEQETEPLPSVLQTHENKVGTHSKKLPLMIIVCGVFLILFAVTYHFTVSVGNESSPLIDHPEDIPFKSYSLAPEIESGGQTNNPHYRSLAPSANHQSDVPFHQQQITDNPSKMSQTGNPSGSEHIQTDNPSGHPLNNPSNGPSNDPSNNPQSASPSDNPSNSPQSALPSDNPSGSPQTGNPSDNPSGSPLTDHPSDLPSGSPQSALPSDNPSGSPQTGFPSDNPSQRPLTGFPSNNPQSGSPSDSTSVSDQTKSPSTNPLIHQQIKSQTSVNRDRRCIYVDRSGYTKDAQMQICNDNFVWSYNPQTKQIKNDDDHGCLARRGSGGWPLLYFLPCSSDDENQKWIISGDTIRAYPITQNECIDIWQESLILKPVINICDSSISTQKWIFYSPTDSPSATDETSSPSNINPPDHQRIKTQSTMRMGEQAECITVKVHAAYPPKMYMTVEMRTCSHGSNYNNQWSYNSQTHQIKKDDDPNACLALDELTLRVEAYECSPNDNTQEWLISGDMIKSVTYNGKCIQIADKDKWNYPNLEVKDCDNSNMDQKWTFY